MKTELILVKKKDICGIL